MTFTAIIIWQFSVCLSLSCLLKAWKLHKSVNPYQDCQSCQMERWQEWLDYFKLQSFDWPNCENASVKYFNFIISKINHSRKCTLRSLWKVRGWLIKWIFSNPTKHIIRQALSVNQNGIFGQHQHSQGC